jgi:hypothetical protein
MDSNNILYGSIILGLLGLVLTYFYLLEATIVQALKKFKKWEESEKDKTN